MAQVPSSMEVWGCIGNISLRCKKGKKVIVNIDLYGYWQGQSYKIFQQQQRKQQQQQQHA